MLNVECRMSNVECRIKIAAIGKDIHNYQLSIIRYSLFVIHYSLFIIHFLCREGRGEGAERNRTDFSFSILCGVYGIYHGERGGRGDFLVVDHFVC